MKCPHCGHEINVGQLIGRLGGQATSKAKTRAARANAKLGGWPKGKKRPKKKREQKQENKDVKGKNRPKDANVLAYETVRKAEKITLQGRPPQRLKVLPNPKAPKRGH